MSKNGPYLSKHVCLREMFHKEKYLSLEKVILIDKLIIIKCFSKRNSLQGWLYRNPPEKNLPAEKRYTVEWDYYSI